MQNGILKVFVIFYFLLFPFNVNKISMHYYFFINVISFKCK